MSKILICIDFQKVFFDKTSPWYVQSIEQAWQCTKDVIKNHYFDKIIFTKYLPDYNNTNPNINEYYKLFPFCLDKSQKHIFDLYEPLDIKNTHNITSDKFGKLRDTGLKHLISHKDDIYICGVSVDCCVLLTVLEMVDEGYKMTIIESCVAGSNFNESIKIMESNKPFVNIIAEF